jgi:hypothetical protein
LFDQHRHQRFVLDDKHAQTLQWVFARDGRSIQLGIPQNRNWMPAAAIPLWYKRQGHAQ